MKHSHITPILISTSSFTFNSNFYQLLILFILSNYCLFLNFIISDLSIDQTSVKVIAVA